MYGPQPKGYWSNIKAPNCGAKHQHLLAGKNYKVVHEFVDHDGQLHPVGESWLFMGYSFLPYEDGLSLFVSLDGLREWHIPMQWREEEQGPIIDKLESHVQEI